MKTPEQLQCRYERGDMRVGCGEEEVKKVALEKIRANGGRGLTGVGTSVQPYECRQNSLQRLRWLPLKPTIVTPEVD